MTEQVRSLSPAKTILLTGAGFTKNFGGYLASEMWEAIFNQTEISECEPLRSCLLQIETLNFEKAYDQILFSGKFHLNEQMIFKRALRAAYEELDSLVLQYTLSHQGFVDYVFRELIVRFRGQVEERGFLFTLNQDMFVERFFHSENFRLTLPGLNNPAWFNLNKSQSPAKEYLVTIPSDTDDIQKLKHAFSDERSESFVYVKLHGSYNWFGKHGGDVMVVGNAKTEAIEGEPLLRWYQELFREAINEPDRKLVVIGYGFGDEHINKEIADAIAKNGLRLYVISPMEPKSFRDILCPVHGVMERVPQNFSIQTNIWEGLAGYYCASVTDLFSTAILGGGPPPRAKSLLRQLDLI
ncbi:MAG: SIR2 family protein [Nitrospirota bacterium]|nr:SIR2 family protein [Nitrospirota bacterium]MDP3597229.1 SIR2 family protein [Nitrospirota bacterium]